MDNKCNTHNIVRKTVRNTVFPLPFFPRIRVTGGSNLITSALSGEKFLIPWIESCSIRDISSRNLYFPVRQLGCNQGKITAPRIGKNNGAKGMHFNIKGVCDCNRDDLYESV